MFTDAEKNDDAGAAELISLAIAGDGNALSDLLRSEEPDLLRRLTDRISPPHRSVVEAQDVVQVTFFEAFLRIQQLQDQGNGAFRAWLWRIAENNLRDAIRELHRDKRPPPEKRIHPNSPDDSYVELLLQLGGTQTSPSQQLARGEARRILGEALDRLPVDYARIVQMSDLEGQSAAEVAAAMGRSVGAVRMLKSRAHNRLAELMGSVAF